MAKNLCNKVGEIGQDNLIAGLYPPAATCGVRLAGGQGILKRGSVLGLDSSNKAYLYDTELSHARYILADDVDTTDGEAVGVAYCAGHFNTKALIMKSGTVEEINDKLHDYGILLSEMQ